MRKTSIFPFLTRQIFSASSFFCDLQLLNFSKMEKYYMHCKQIRSKKWDMIMKLFRICIKLKIRAENMPMSLCFLSFMILQNRQCVEREMWWRNKKQTLLVEGLFALMFVCQWDTLKWITPLSVCLFLNQSTCQTAIWSFLYCDRKRIWTFCTACWIYTNWDFTCTKTITFIQSQNIHIYSLTESKHSSLWSNANTKRWVSPNH